MHRTAGPLARVPGVRDGRVSAPYFEPSWATLASTGRQSTAWATQTARPTSAFDRAQGGTARSALASAHLAFTPATATKEVASAAQMKPVRLVWEPHAVPLSPALLTTPKPTPRNPSRPSLHELVARIDRAVQLSHALPTIKFETTNIRPQKRPAPPGLCQRLFA
ncbi:hypothetical protein EMIHUDRAFT_256104 [Emiliania huxleyi CCMP1516]|uniref:Uncharacterized protein n=2 Tax=Emiliania huxleyi TaxID=2903 RepID=A0A0D3IZI4_EMIH1|nr:hypothetical protein EMIHUDRAFT_256104 [Emiliania huxleyi CCMP1516]EOD16669.1 hypothetical protein EMIHUDRAFT_256104 [Emiliania huxleyi CCMP1516]|eukprot:XP_005769098.1 hypothetical protein EMIHUDRAFT_256104 [Emiliania huxleyi CCMP1516]